MIGYFADDFAFIAQFADGYTVRQLLFANTDGMFGGGSWRPLTMLQYWLTFGTHLSAFAQHIISLALYILCGWLLYLLLKKDGAPLAVCIAVVWILWPVHVEPALWIAARADLIAAACALAALIAAREEKMTAAVVWYIASLLAKEVWVLLPVVFLFLFSSRTRLRAFLWSGLAAITWFFIRWHLTGFGVGGYSVSPVPWEARLFLMNEQVLTFVSGIFLYGGVQASVVAWVTEWWFITSYVVWGSVIALICKLRNVVAPLILLLTTLAPILLLKVPFVSGHATIAEQRYWLAATIAVAWLVARLFSQRQKWVLYIMGLYFAIGFLYNFSLVFDAAHYRDQVLDQWRVVSATSTPLTAFFLPDTFAGVHLLASPYFEAAVRQAGMKPPAAVAPTYSQHGPGLVPRYMVGRLEGRVYVKDTERRFFSLNRAGIHADLSEAISPTSTIAAWDGQEWVILPPPVDKSNP